MTVTVLELTLGMLLVYCAIFCRAFVKALGGQSVSGTHCTGSLIALTVAGLSYFFYRIFGEGLAAALGGLIGGRAGRGGRGRTSPSPSPLPLPTPTPTPLPAPGGGEGVGAGTFTINVAY